MSKQTYLPFPKQMFGDNAFGLLGYAHKIMRKAKIEQIKIDEFTKEATSSDYKHLLKTIEEYFEVEE